MNDRNGITLAEIERLRGLIAAANVLPWEAWRQYDPLRGMTYGITAADGDTTVIGRDSSYGPDMDLIDAAVNSLPALLDSLAVAWDEGFDAGERDVQEHETFDEPCIPNPYRKAVV